MKKISIIIPVRRNGNPEITLKSLSEQTYKNFEIIISWDEGHGSNWARNRGAEKATSSSYLLFSDDDIQWRPNALLNLTETLMYSKESAYSYGAYKRGEDILCAHHFDATRLKQNNYISTMSLIRRECFPGFDESIYRLQDWDLWLTMLRKGHKGIYCGAILFDTAIKDGITFGNPLSWQDARNIVAKKHDLSGEITKFV